MVLLIDNYDSFVHNLARYVRELGLEAVVRRNDALSLDEIAALAPSHIILSPGPCTPAEAGISIPVVRRFGSTTPILGVCLGHQCIGAAYGADIVRATRPMHGKTSSVAHAGASIFTGLPSPIRVARYHSLVIAPASMPPSLRILATACDDGEIMAVEHRTHPVVGVQFHPESAASEYGYAMLDRFLRGAQSRPGELPTGADGAHEAAEHAASGPLPWSPLQDGSGRSAFVPPPVEAVTGPSRSYVPPSARPSTSSGRTVEGPEPIIASPGAADIGRDDTHQAPSVVWINGERQVSSGLHVSARDRGLTLADGVFETMRAHGGRVFQLDRHLARLEDALSTLEIPVPPELRDWVLAAVRAVSDADGETIGGKVVRPVVGNAASVRLTVTRGIAAGGGVAPPIDAHPTVIVAVGAMPVFVASVYDVGLTAHVASGRRNEHAMTAGLKTLAYTDAVAAMIEAQRAGADDALFLDTEGHCSEATSSNLFAWTGTTLVTPPLSCGALPGITRAAVLELATALGVPTLERPLELEQLLAGEEAFLTSSLRGIAPLVRVDAHPIGGGLPGALTRQLADAYTALVARECGG